MTGPGSARERTRPSAVVLGAVGMAWKADRAGFVWAAALQVVGSLAPAALIVVGQRLVTLLLATDGESPSRGSVLVTTVLLAVVTAAASAATVLQQQRQRLLAERVSALTWDEILNVTVQVPYEKYEDPSFYDRLQRIKNNAVSQPITVTTSIFGLLGSAVGTVGLLVVVLTVSPLLAAILLVAGLPTLILARRASKIEFAFLDRAMPVYRGRQYMRDVLSGRDEAKEIRVFRADRPLRRRHDERKNHFDALLAQHTKRRVRLALLSVASSAVFLVVTLGLSVEMLLSGRIDLAGAAATILAVRFLATSLEGVFRALGGLFESSGFLMDLAEFLRQDLPIAEDHDEGGAVLRDRIQLSGVGFTYPGTSNPVLTDIDVHVGAGEVIALVGENGSGKTTLAKLIAGLYSPSAGTVSWDGVPYADTTVSASRAGVAAIFQDFVRYQLSAQDNIGIGDPRRVDDADAAQRAAVRANAWPFLADLPNGLDTVLSREYENGVDLSIGQWQRVALARALRKDAAVVILDEPSASLDPRAEASLFADIRTTIGDRSAVLITHRFASVQLADRIYVLERGRIKEFGTHDELVAARGLYADLYDLQARAFLPSARD